MRPRTLLLISLMMPVAIQTPLMAVDIIESNRLTRAEMPLGDYAGYNDEHVQDTAGLHDSTSYFTSEDYNFALEYESQARARQTTYVSQGLNGRSVVTGHGQSEIALTGNVICDGHWKPYARSELNVKFSSDCGFAWTLDYSMLLQSSWFVTNATANCDISIKRLGPDGDRVTDLVFQRYCYVSNLLDITAMTESNVVEGWCPPGDYVITALARTGGRGCGDVPEGAWDGSSASWQLDFKTRCDISGFDFGFEKQESSLSGLPWKNVFDVLDDFGAAGDASTDHDGNGLVDVDDVISALDKAIGKHDPVPAVADPGSAQDAWKGDDFAWSNNAKASNEKPRKTGK